MKKEVGMRNAEVGKKEFQRVRRSDGKKVGNWKDSEIGTQHPVPSSTLNLIPYTCFFGRVGCAHQISMARFSMA